MWHFRGRVHCCPGAVVEELLCLLAGPLTSMVLGVWIFHIRAVPDLLVWGCSWGLMASAVIGLLRLHKARRTRRADEEKTREALGALYTDREHGLALRAARHGPVPADPRIRRMAARLAADHLDEVPRGARRAPVFFMIVGGVFFTLGMISVIQDLGDLFLSALGWNTFTEHLSSWRLRRRANYLRERLDE